MALSSSLSNSVLRIADLKVDPALDEISKDGHTTKLEPKAMQLLICLAERAGEVVSVEELLDRVWKDVIVSHDSVYAAVAALRRTLGDDSKKPTYIANVVRRGYRLIAPVSAWVEPGVSARTGVAQAPPDRPSIAVLPLLNLSGDPAQDYFSDGVTADIITELSRWRRLAVRSRSASFRYRGSAVDLRQVARELDVRYVVEGTVRRVGERIRISVQLVEADTGSHVWGEKFDRGSEDIFSVQDQVVQTIVSTLSGRIQASDAERARRKPPSSLAAYEYVLRCNALSWDEPGRAEEATRLVEKAIELDPSYGYAYALLAAILLYSESADSVKRSGTALARVHALATRALELDAGESTCYSVMGDICALQGSFELAVQYSRRAVELNPTNQWNAADLGSLLVYVGEPEEGLRWFVKARDIDPYFDEPWYWRVSAIAYVLLHRYQEALAALARVRVRAYQTPALTAACHAEMGATALAKASVAECLSIKPDFSIRQFVRDRPFKMAGHAEQLASALRLAGLPDSPPSMSVTQPTEGAADPPWVGDVLQFWFAELGEADWFAMRADLDARIRDRFLALHTRLAADDAFVGTTPRALVAAVIVLDQFSRNLYRGTLRAFAADPMARRLSRSAVDRGLDVGLTKPERLFLYLPFEHSESRRDQALAVELISQLGDEAWTRYAAEHKAMIDRFGRFPYRNTILGRVSSAEELAALEDRADWWV